MPPIPPAVVNIVQGIVTEIINPLIGIIFAAALVLFIYGLLVFIIGAGDEAKKTTGKQHLLWGIIGMTVMVTVFTILQIGLATFEVDPPGYINFTY